MKVRDRSSSAGRFRLKVPTDEQGTVRVRADVPADRASRHVACRPRVLTVTTPIPYQPSPANSIRAVYAVASDQSIQPGKVAAIVADIGIVNRWFATQTIHRVQPRWVRNITAAGSAGHPKVVTVRLAHTAAEYSGAKGLDLLDMVAADLAAAAPAESTSERAVVWIDVDSTSACGITYPKELTVLLDASCGIPASTEDTWPYGGTYLLAHELTHNFGGAPDCAPHSIGGGHVGDDPRDVVFAGHGDRDWDHLMLDPGHDDYYATGRADCEDIALSPFWTRTSAPGS